MARKRFVTSEISTDRKIAKLTEKNPTALQSIYACKVEMNIVLDLCLAACFLGRPYEYSEVLDETLGAEVLQQQRMAGLP